MDYDLWWRLYHKFGPLGFVDAEIAINRQHPDSKTLNQRHQHYAEAIEVVRRHYGRVPLKWWIAQPSCMVKALAFRAATGDSDLTQRWEAAVTAGEPEQLPSALRREVLAALAGTDSAAALLDPPSYDEIQRALVHVDADALVYLVPGTGVVTGYAVCAPARGAPRYLALPNLTSRTTTSPASSGR